MRPSKVGLIGDYGAGVTAHRAIPLALHIASAVLGCAIEETWLPTTELVKAGAIDLESFDGFWSVPASPYQSADGALRATRFARERQVPFLGTCGGFQHAVLEYARNVLGHRDAGHTELDPSAGVPLFAALSCSMVEVDGTIHFTPASRLAGLYGCRSVVERYHCRYGMNPAFESWFANGAMAITGVDDAGEPRAIELDGHPFFIGTAYQPERSALAGQPHPLVLAFVRALSK